MGVFRMILSGKAAHFGQSRRRAQIDSARRQNDAGQKKRGQKASQSAPTLEDI
jgi:hypothetical protein